MPAGLSSWCVLCGRAGSSALMSGISPRRSLRPTCCGQITARSQTGQLQACHMSLPPSPSCQGMRSPTTLPKNTCPLRYDTPRACHKQHAICTGICTGTAYELNIYATFFCLAPVSGVTVLLAVLGTCLCLHAVKLRKHYLLCAYPQYAMMCVQ